MSNDEILLIADQRVLSIPVIDNHEPLFNLINQTEIVCGPSPEIPNNTDYTQMRERVYQKLLEAQKLLPEGLRFCLYESYRSLDLQKTLFDNRYQKIQKKYPDWPHESLFLETIKLVSPVVNLDGSQNIPPHATGAAVDVYLIDRKGHPIEMGIHPKDWMEDTDGLISQTDSSGISKEAQENRELMSKVLSAVGFENYPTEYWHWSYGDRYWAYMSSQPNAIYGVV